MNLLMSRLLTGLGLAVTTLAALSAPAASAAPGVTGFIVQLRDEAGGGDARMRMQSVQAVLSEQRLPLALDRELGQRWHALVPTAALDGASARALEARLRADPRVARVVPNVREQRLDVTPSDARFAEQWWLKSVAAGNAGVAGFAKAWERSTGVANAAPVAVLDSGITSHIELNARVLPGYDFVADAIYSGDGNGRDADYQDPGDAISASDRAAHPAAFSGCPETPSSSWHGTSIAGQLAAVSNNTEGVAAANWQGTVLPVRVAGKCGAAVADIVDGLRWAAGLAVAGVPANPNPARLIVLSYGSIDACDVNSNDAAVRDTAQLYVDTLAAVRAKGALVFVAAGNQRREVGRPASCAGAFAVAAANREGIKSSYSNFGAKVALLATGGDAAIGASCDAQLADTGIVTTGNLGQSLPGQAGYVAASGTSFAAPQVAAVASLMLGLNPGLTVAQIEDGLQRSARPHVKAPLLGDCALGSNVGRCSCTTTTCGAGLLDADQALAFALAPTTWQAPSCSASVLVDERHVACAAVLGRSLPDPLPSAVTGSCQAGVTPAPTTPTTPTTPSTPGGGGSGGGGAMGWGWMLGLLAALATLAARNASNAGWVRPHSGR